MPPITAASPGRTSLHSNASNSNSSSSRLISVPRLICVAFCLWVGCVLYAHTIFVKIAPNTVEVHAKGADRDLLSAKENKRQFLKQAAGAAAKVLGEKAAQATADANALHEAKRSDNVDDDNPQDLNAAPAENGMTRDAAENICVKSKHRENCIHNVMSTSDIQVAHKFVGFMMAVEKKEGVVDDSSPVSMHDAKIACALAIDKANCIHDVLGTGDIDAAESYDQVDHPDKAKGHRMTPEQAQQACKMIHQEDQDKCQQHVMDLNDSGKMTHYIHLLQDEEHSRQMQDGTSDKVTAEEVKQLCAKTLDQFKCMKNVRTLAHKHVAEHYVELLHNHNDAALVNQQDAETLCNHLMDRKQRPKCVKDLANHMNALDAAMHYTNLFEQASIKGPTLTAEQVAEVCEPIMDPAMSKECLHDVETMTNLETAKVYVEVWMDSAGGDEESLNDVAQM